MTPDWTSDLEAAKEMFFFYDGSRFYMSRNDEEQRYLDYRVPPSIQAEWLSALTDARLAGLDERGNWWSVKFLVNHRDTRHLAQVAATEPLGVFWEKCAFLEHLLRYVAACQSQYPAQELADVCDVVAGHAARLRRRVRADGSVRRVTAIAAKAFEIREGLSNDQPPGRTR